MSEILTEGHQTLVTFALAPTVEFKEKTVTPPGLDGGGENDTTTMHNVRWRTRQPKELVTATEMSLTVAYDPACYSSVVEDLLNENGEITITFPDGSTVVFWGWVNTFSPNEIVEGEQPTAEVTIIPSNQDDSGAELGPVYSAA